MKQRIYHLQALSALHVGVGQGVGAVDLPIARGRATQLPFVPGSALKGVLRDELRDEHGRLTPEHKRLFGPEAASGEDPQAGALAVGDAQLLIFPARSFLGVVAFATCPFILRRYARDLLGPNEAPPPLPPDEGPALTPRGSVIVKDNKLFLEDLDQEARPDSPKAEAWAERIAKTLYPDDCSEKDDWRREFQARFVILPDGLFDFLAETATEIRARVRIDPETRTVAPGALWYEENLPAESVLWGVLGVTTPFNRNRDAQVPAEDPAGLLPRDRHLQIGGKHTVGRGLCRWLLSA